MRSTSVLESFAWTPEWTYHGLSGNCGQTSSAAHRKIYTWITFSFILTDPGGSSRDG
jgi:hypothetical protein